MNGGAPDTAMWAACTGLLEAAGIRTLAMGWSAVGGQLWWATAEDSTGTRVTVKGRGAAMALAAVTEQVALNCKCECGQPIVISDRAQYANPYTCRWHLAGRRFEPTHPRTPAGPI